MIQPFGIAFLRYAIADEGKAWRTKGDEFVRIHRNVAGSFTAERCGGGSVLDEVASHPVVLSSRKTLDGFAEVAAQQRGSAFAGRAHEHHRESLIEGHCDERSFAVAGHAIDANMLCINTWI